MRIRHSESCTRPHIHVRTPISIFRARAAPCVAQPYIRTHRAPPRLRPFITPIGQHAGRRGRRDWPRLGSLGAGSVAAQWRLRRLRQDACRGRRTGARCRARLAGTPQPRALCCADVCPAATITIVFGVGRGRGRALAIDTTRSDLDGAPHLHHRITTPTSPTSQAHHQSSHSSTTSFTHLWPLQCLAAWQARYPGHRPAPPHVLQHLRRTCRPAHKRPGHRHCHSHSATWHPAHKQTPRNSGSHRPAHWWLRSWQGSQSHHLGSPHQQRRPTRLTRGRPHLHMRARAAAALHAGPTQLAQSARSMSITCVDPQGGALCGHNGARQSSSVRSHREGEAHRIGWRAKVGCEGGGGGAAGAEAVEALPLFTCQVCPPSRVFTGLPVWGRTHGPRYEH